MCAWIKGVIAIQLWLITAKQEYRSYYYYFFFREKLENYFSVVVVVHKISHEYL